MKKRTLLKMLIATTAFLAACLFGCNFLENNPKKSEFSSVEQSEISEEPPCAHVFDEWMPHEEPNCEYDGFKMRICTICGEEDELILPALGHTPDEYLRYEPTCLRGGSVSQSCTRCGEILYFESLAKLTTHEPTITSVDSKPTCTISGYEQKHCDCGEVIINTFSPSLGGHIDEDNDLICDTCEEKVRSIPVYLKFQGNATATAEDSILISKESGGIVNLKMGENSIFYQSLTCFQPLPDDPDFLGGNVVCINPSAATLAELEAYTSTYQHRVYDNPTFGEPTAVTLEIADTTQTAIVILEQFRIPTEETQSYFGQVLLFWGELSTKITVTGMNSSSLTISYYTDMEGNILSYEKTIDVLLTEPVTYLRVYYSKP